MPAAPETLQLRVMARIQILHNGLFLGQNDEEVAALFTEGMPNSLSVPWAQARVVFKLAQPVKTITLTDDVADIWPKSSHADEVKLSTDNGGVAGAINLFFFRDVEIGTAHAWFGGGPVLYGEESGANLNATDFIQVIAHEVGHALCLPHVCPNDKEKPSDTSFQRACQSGDEAFLMYPYYDASDSMQIPTAHADQARDAATHLEEGKTTTSGLNGFGCGAADTAG